jgi:hypothetical protein
MDALFVLAREGFHYEVMEVVRSNREALDLVVLFLQEPADGPLLKRWFDGQIVKNARARDAFEAFIAEMSRATNIPVSVRGLKLDIYGALSRYSHVSYAALLDAYDVYHQDFDFDRVAGYHYVRTSSLPFVREEIRSATIGLKGFYAWIKDGDAYRALDAILQRQTRGDEPA